MKKENKYFRISPLNGLRIISQNHLILKRVVIDNKIIYYESLNGDVFDSSRFVLIKYFRDDYYFLNKKYCKFAKELKIKL